MPEEQVSSLEETGSRDEREVSAQQRNMNSKSQSDRDHGEDEALDLEELLEEINEHYGDALERLA